MSRLMGEISIEQTETSVESSWSYCCQSWCNFLDSGFCAVCVVLQREYKFFTVILELHKVLINLQIPDEATFW